MPYESRRASLESRLGAHHGSKGSSMPYESRRVTRPALGAARRQRSKGSSMPYESRLEFEAPGELARAIVARAARCPTNRDSKAGADPSGLRDVARAARCPTNRDVNLSAHEF